MGLNNSILIIDDEEDIQDVLREILVPEGYAVTSAASGNEALEILKNNRDFSLVLLDFRLPDMSGFDLVSSARGEFLENIPVVMLSGTAGLKQLQLPPGVVGAICKPFDIEELLKAVRRFGRRDSADMSGLQGYPAVS